MLAFISTANATPGSHPAAWIQQRSAPYEWSAPIPISGAAAILTYARDQTVEVLDARTGGSLSHGALRVGVGLRLVGTTSTPESNEILAVCFDRTAVYAFSILPSAARLLWRSGDAFDQPEDVRDDPEFLSRLVDAAITPAGVLIVRDDGTVGLLALSDGALLRRASVPRSATYRAFSIPSAALVLSCGAANRASVFPLRSITDDESAAAASSQSATRPPESAQKWPQSAFVTLPEGPTLFSDIVGRNFVFATRREFVFATDVSPTPRRIPRWRGLRAAAIALVAPPSTAPSFATVVFADEGASLQGRAADTGELLWFVSTADESDARRAAGDIRIFDHAPGLVVWGDERELFCSRTSDGAIVADWRIPADQTFVAACQRGNVELVVLSSSGPETLVAAIPLSPAPRSAASSRSPRIRLPADASAPREVLPLESAPPAPRHVFIAGDMLIMQDANTIAAYGIAP